MKTICKDCNINPRRFNSTKKVYYSYCIDCAAKRDKAMRSKSGFYQKRYKKEKAKNPFVSSATVFKKYGITVDDYNRMFKEQDGRCAICNNHQNIRKLAVDHNHKTGKVRGLLCINCNRGLGHYFDSTYRLNKAIDYLNNTR